MFLSGPLLFLCFKLCTESVVEGVNFTQTALQGSRPVHVLRIVHSKQPRHIP